MKNFEIIVRAVILHKNKILFCQRKNRSYFFLPGGHVEFSEKAVPALIREIKEELGIALKQPMYIGIIENIYFDKDENKKHHEINLIFSGQVKKSSVKTNEDHIDFFWIKVRDLKNKQIEPVVLKTCLIKWLKDKKSFWGSEV